MTVSWSINALDENFRPDMDKAVSIERRMAAMRQVCDTGIRTDCFISLFFPEITDFEAIFQRGREQLIWCGWKTWTCGAVLSKRFWNTSKRSIPTCFDCIMLSMMGRTADASKL